MNHRFAQVHQLRERQCHERLNHDNPRTVDTHVLSLRKKIEPDPRQPNLIQTVRNIGYKFNLEFLMDISKRQHDLLKSS